jgi:hypothetical protein
MPPASARVAAAIASSGVIRAAVRRQRSTMRSVSRVFDHESARVGRGEQHVVSADSPHVTDLRVIDQVLDARVVERHEHIREANLLQTWVDRRSSGSLRPACTSLRRCSAGPGAWRLVSPPRSDGRYSSSAPRF